VSILAIVLLSCAVLLVVGAEWPRLSAGMRSKAAERDQRERDRRKSELRVIEGGDRDDFAESVRRDLDQLPVIEEPNDRKR
jgi:hypothetical protein